MPSHIAKTPGQKPEEDRQAMIRLKPKTDRQVKLFAGLSGKNFRGYIEHAVELQVAKDRAFFQSLRKEDGSFDIDEVIDAFMARRE